MVAVGTAIGTSPRAASWLSVAWPPVRSRPAIQTAAAMQQARSGFKTLLGSAQAAGDYLK
jgi:hypothetical protein